MPDPAGREENGPGDDPDAARRVFEVPVITDQDVLDRVAAVISPGARQGLGRTAWFFFLDAQGTQARLIVPVTGIPERPSPVAALGMCRAASELLARAFPGGSAVVTLSRPGSTAVTDSDRHILGVLRQGNAAYGTPVRMYCLATPEGILELGPAPDLGGPGPGV